jgi:hypothetical protein
MNRIAAPSRRARHIGRWRRLLGRALAPALVIGLWLVLASGAWVGAASPEPEPTTGIIGSGDPRSNGQGPGLVGSPFEILGGVILLGLVTAGGTLLFLRVTRED